MWPSPCDDAEVGAGDAALLGIDTEQTFYLGLLV